MAGGDYGRWSDRQLASFLPLMDHIPLDITAVIVVSAILISSPVWMKDNDAIKILERVCLCVCLVWGNECLHEARLVGISFRENHFIFRMTSSSDCLFLINIKTRSINIII